MNKKEFNKLVKRYDGNYHMLIRLYCMGKFYFTESQIGKILKLRGERVSKEQY